MVPISAARFDSSTTINGRSTIFLGFIAYGETKLLP